MSGSDDGHSGTAASFTDLMTSLAIAFVLITVALFNRRSGTMGEERAQLVAALKGPLRAAGLADSSVKDDSTAVVIILPDSALFKRGEDTLVAGGAVLVARLMPAVADTLCAPRFRTRIDALVIEGHTDRTHRIGVTPEAGRLHNLGLSQRRSMNFVSKTTEGLLDTSRLNGANRNRVFDCFIQLTSATGRGEETPRQEYPDTSAAQRRVMLRITLKRARTDSIVTTLAPSPTGRDLK